MCMSVYRWRRGLKQQSYSIPGPDSSEMGDRMLAGKPPRFVTSYSGQLSRLPSAEWKMNTGHSEMKLCGWGVKAGMVYSTGG